MCELTLFVSLQVGDTMRSPGQVNNIYIFPGVSFGAIACQVSIGLRVLCTY